MTTINDFNLLGKVDSSKTVITPSEFIFKFKEANAVTNIDYEKFKQIMNVKSSALEPTNEWIEKEKERQFQNTFKQLWPNVYDRINPKVEPPKTTAELLAELETKRKIADLVALQDLEKHKAALAQAHLLSNYSSVYSSKYNDSLNITINGLNSGAPKIEISSTNPPPPPPKPAPEPDKSKYPNLYSSYDFPLKTSKYLEKIVKSPYNPGELSKEAELLKSIQESQEKLKMAHKLEKTTDLVDDIIGKVKVLQDEMKKKSAEIKLQNDIENLKKEYENLRCSCSSSLSVRFDDAILIHDHDLHHRHHHHHHDHGRRSRSKERPHTSIGSYLSSDSSSDRKNERSTSRRRSSILKAPKANVAFKYSSSCAHRSKSSDKSKPKSNYVSPKVDCWNCNCSHDKNVY